MSNPYAAKPVTPEYLAESKVAGYAAGTIVPFAIASTFYFARVYSRVFLLRKWGWDDSLLLGAWLGAVALFGIDMAMIPVGIGKHVQTTSMPDGIRLLQLSYAVKLVYMASLGLTKLAVARFYLRIFTDKLSRTCCWAIIVWIMVTTVTTMCLAIFRCSPIPDAWKLYQANCPIDGSLIVGLTGGFNIAGDVALIAFVLPRIANLQMARRQKAVLLVIVATSFLIIVAALIRTIGSIRTVDDFDQTWVQADIGIWSVVEVNTGIFCASIVAIKPLVRVVYPKLLSSLPFSSHSGQSGSSNGTRDTKERFTTDKSMQREMGARSLNTAKESDTSSMASNAGIVQTTDIYHHSYEVDRKGDDNAQVGIALV